MKTKIERDGKEYMVSTVDTFDKGWETMVFEMREGEVYYADLACRRYEDEQQATAVHIAMVADFQPD
jgi:hypothetical protein